ncbi:uncharacterized protein ACIBXB_005907 [Morphnus guianensis]
MPMLGVDSIGQLKCIYANARSMGNKQEEQEAIVQQDRYDLVAITETWWDDSHDWSAAMDGYKLFRRDRQGKRGGGVALYVRECFDCTELHDSDNKVECLWVRMRGKANKADIVLGVCYRLPDQVEETDETFYKRLAVVSESCALVLVGDFNFPDICWKYNTAESKQSRRFLECVEDNFLTQLVGEPTRAGALLDLLFTNREGLVGGSGELQACQPDLGTREDYGTVCLESTHVASPGQAGDQAQSAWVYERQVLLDQRDLLL